MSQDIDEIFNVESRGGAASLLNPYEVLQPIKVDTVLVDISTDEERSIKNINESLQMGSFIDTIRKTEYDLVDLYQNIYVTPQHMQRSDKQDENDAPIDFTDFFDELENKNDRLNESTDDTKNSANAEIIPDFDKLCDKLCKTSTFRGLNQPSTAKTNFNVSDKTLNVQSETFNSHKNISDIIKTDAQYFVNDFTLYNNNDLKTKYELNHLNETKLSILESKSIKKDPKVEKKGTDHINLDDVLQITSINFNFMNDLRYKIKNTRKQQVIDMINDKQFNGIIKTGPLLQTVKKDEKLYAKQCVYTQRNKNLTKGADIYEKSIVLPQIMERLAVRKKALDEQNKLKRRLVLDAGTLDATKHQNVLEKGLDPVVLMKDCNKQRLKDLGARLLFVDFVKNGKTH